MGTIRNYRRIGGTPTSYLSSLGSGKSQGNGESIGGFIKDSVKLTFNNITLNDIMKVQIKDKVERVE